MASRICWPSTPLDSIVAVIASAGAVFDNGSAEIKRGVCLMNAESLASTSECRTALSRRRIGAGTASIERWEQEEISRSAEEARKTTIHFVDCRRYITPPAHTAYPLEYAFHLVGKLRNTKTVDFWCRSGESTRRSGDTGCAVNWNRQLSSTATIGGRKTQSYWH